MIIKDIKEKIVYVEYNSNNYMIKRDYIGGTMIENYFIYGCYGIDDYDYEIADTTTFEDALLRIKDYEERG